MITAAQLRRIILGQEGPWADPRYALDSIDNLAELVSELDAAGRTELIHALVELFIDPDPIVQTGAVMGLQLVRRDIERDWFLAAVERAQDHLRVAPIGFNRAWRPTILDEALDIVPPSAPPAG